MQECKDAEPDVLFVGDSLVQLMQQFEVRQDICHSTPGPLIVQVAVAFLCDIFLNLNIFAQFSRCNSSLSALVSYLILVAQVWNSPIKCRFLISCLQVWRELFSPLHALNFGLAGDTTCNVLWRLQNGELENIRPKVRRQCVAKIVLSPLAHTILHLRCRTNVDTVRCCYPENSLCLQVVSQGRTMCARSMFVSAPDPLILLDVAEAGGLMVVWENSLSIRAFVTPAVMSCFRVNLENIILQCVVSS